jgi:hypothetical protein
MTEPARSLWASKTRAWAVHLAISCGVLLPVFAVIFFFWYPGPFFTVQDAGRVVGVLIGVDLVLGPLLTFIVFKPGKKHLKFDLTVIAALQLVALAYGTHTIWSERPRFVVFAVDRYEVLARPDVDFARAGMDGFGEGDAEGVTYAFAEMPMGQAFQRFQDGVLFGGQPDLERRPEFWRVLDGPRVDAVLAAAQSLDSYRLRGEKAYGVLRDKATALGLDPETALVTPVVGKGGDFLGFLDPETARVRGVLETDPWLER